MGEFSPLLGYCTNVHAGVTLREIKQNLEQHAVRVREQLVQAGTLRTSDKLGVGLWIPHPAALELDDTPDAVARFADWLDERALVPYTFNGFPYDNFHMPVVKHRVYHPTWCDPSRLDYTLRLFRLMDRLLPAGKTGSISTLPISWGQPSLTESQWDSAANALKRVALELKRIEANTGRRMVLAIEPEPGCALQTTPGIVEFFERWLPETELRRYLTVCHDVCHAAVMNESQTESLFALRNAGIGVGKVQVSAAIEVPWRGVSAIQRSEMLQQLRGFAEDRYLHQTGCVREDGTFELIEDLPELMQQGPRPHDDTWRIHFHMPIHLEQAGALRTTQREILACFDTLKQPSAPDWTGHFEVETYAWSVLPPSLRPATLAVGIALELQWLAEAIR